MSNTYHLRVSTAPFRRVRRAYEQVADQLRDLITSGELGEGDRLPNEAQLAAQFGVSRATLREALRTLSAQGLVASTVGPAGGTFVHVPSSGNLAGMVSPTLHLLTGVEQISLDELLEARALIEVPAARLAAERRTDTDLAELSEAIPADAVSLPVDDRFRRNRDFHGVVVSAAGNALLALAADPIFLVLQTHLSRTALDAEFHREIAAQHATIVSAIRDGDPEGAETEMRAHLAFLRPFYEIAWQTLGTDAR